MIDTLASLALDGGHDIYRFVDAPSEEKALKQAFVGGAPSSTGLYVSESNALKYTAVYACVRIIAEDVATLPLHVYSSSGNGKQDASGLYFYPLLHDAPNPEMTAVSFWETCMHHLLMWGNAYIQLQWDGAGRLKGMWPLLPDQMKVGRDSKTKRITYTYRAQSMQPTDVLHIPGLAFDGIVGYSPISLAREAIGLGLAPELYAANFYRNNAQPGMVLVTDQVLAPEQREQIAGSWDAIHAGLKGAGVTGVLEGGLKPIMPSMSQADAQFIESRMFQLQEICRIYRVPPHMVADLSHGTYSNIENQDIGYSKWTVRPWCRRIEAALRMKLFAGTRYFAEFNLDGLQRGDIKSRYEALAIARQQGVINANEWRALDNWNPIPGPAGEMYIVNGAMVPTDKAGADKVQPEVTQNA